MTAVGESLFGESAYATTRDQRKLHYITAGRGVPVVVFEAGMGSSHLGWGLVQPAVAKHTRTVVYDRAGFGRSPRDSMPRTLERAAADLRDLLDHLGDGPFVLVGHSWGGSIVRRAAALDPERVRGLVLVDASDEGCDLYLEPATIRQQRFFACLLPLAARTGLLRLAVRRLARPLPAELADEVARSDSTVASARALQAELTPFADDLRRLRAQPEERIDIPMTVISGMLRSRYDARVREAIVAAHERRAALSSHGRHVRAERSGHHVQLTEPELVVREILELVRLANPAPR